MPKVCQSHFHYYCYSQNQSLKPLNSTLLLSTQNDDDKKKNNTEDNDGDCT